MIACPDCKSPMVEQIRPGFFVRRIDLVCTKCGTEVFQGGGVATGQGMLDAVATDQDAARRKAMTTLALDDVLKEREAQHERWGDQSGHPDTVWLAILTEEVGEVAQALLHDQFGGKAAGTLRDELVQIVAVGVAWLEAIETRRRS